MLSSGMPYIIPLIIGAVLSFVLITFTWIRHPSSKAGVFTWMMFAIAEWSLGYALELTRTDLASKIFWAKMEYFGISFLPVSWFILALRYYGKEHWIKKWSLVLLNVLPVITLVLVWTNEYHGLVWRSMSLENGTFFSTLLVKYGWWFWVHAIYSYLLLILGIIFYIAAIIRFPNLFQVQIIALLTSIFLPFVTNFLYIFRFITWFDPTPFAFVITGLLLSRGFLHFNLLEMVPVARYAVVENMSDLVIILDLQNRILDLNPAAEIFITHSTSNIIGQPIDKALSAWPDLAKDNFFEEDVMEQAKEVELIEDNGIRHFELRFTPLLNHRGRLTGRLLILRDITERKKAENLLSNVGRLQKILEEMIQAMSMIVEKKDSYTAEHQRRVAKLAKAIGSKLGLSESELEAIYLAAIIHDIGKIYIPSEILNKPGRLSEAEFAIIKNHPNAGYDILKMIEFPWPIARIVQQHHERIDGTGYPYGLTATDILLAAKIITVADVVESMSNDRPYRPALGVEKALAEITSNRGILYDPAIVDACINLFVVEGYDFEIPRRLESLG